MPLPLSPFGPLLGAVAAAWALGVPSAASAADAEDLEALLNQPVYAASKFAQAASAAPATVTVVTAGDIRTHGWRTLGEVLQSVRGVHLRQDRLYTYVGVRGFSRPGDYTSRLLLLVDGQRINDNIYDQAVAGREFPLDVELIERVEFIAGPGSALYGSNAVLGVVNVVTRAPAAAGAPAASLTLGSHGQQALRLGMGMRLGETSLAINGLRERVAGRTQYHAAMDNPPIQDGLAHGLDHERSDKLMAKLQHGKLNLNAVWSDRQRAPSTAPFGLRFGDPLVRFTDRYAFVGAAWQSDPSQPQAVSVQAALADFLYRDLGRYEPAGEVYATGSRGRWAALEARWVGRLWPGHVVVAGVELQHNLKQDLWVEQREPLLNTEVQLHTRSHREAAFITDEWQPWPQLKLNLGLRADRQLNGQHSITPRLAAVWSLRPDLTFKAMSGRAFREPNVYESRYESFDSMANPLLQRERLISNELALEWHPRAAPWRVAGSVYRYRIAGLIEQELDAQSQLLVYRNRGQAQAQGLELEADYVAEQGWRLRATAAFQRPRDALGQALSDGPRHVLGLQGSLPVRGTALRLGLHWRHVGTRLALDGSTVPGYSLADLTLQHAPPGRAWALQAGVYNLMNTPTADPSGPELAMPSVPGPGRELRLQLNWRF